MISRKKFFPSTRFILVDLEPMTNQFRKHIDFMKSLFGEVATESVFVRPGDEDHARLTDDPNTVIEIQPNQKYIQDFYYIAPFYHMLFPNLFQLVALDLDLEFRVSLSSLKSHFEQFTSSNLIGLGLDLSPHYALKAKAYQEANPGTWVGTPGKGQVVSLNA